MDGELPHLLIYGPPGAGKSTRVQALLHEIFGASASNIRKETRTFRLSSNRLVDVDLKLTDHSVEMSPAGLDEESCSSIMQELILDIVRTRPRCSMVQFTEERPSQARSFRVLVIKDANTLPEQAQAALRRTMEMHTAHCRVIFTCCSFNIMEAIRSRCLCVRVPAPSSHDISLMLMRVAKAESLPLTLAKAASIVKMNGRNMHAALMSLQCTRAGGEVQISPWRKYAQGLAVDVVKGVDPIPKVRAKVKEILNVDVAPRDLIVYMSRALSEHFENCEHKMAIIGWAAECDVRAARGGDCCIHIESFFMKVRNI